MTFLPSKNTKNSVNGRLRMDFGNETTSIVEEETTSSLSQMDKQWHGVENSEEHVHFRLFNISICPIISRARCRRLQALCYNFLERPSGIICVSYHFLIFGLVVVGLVFAILQTMEELRTATLNLGIYVLEMFLLIIFSLEYILRTWSAGCRSTYVGFFGRLRFAVKPFVIVDLIVVASTAAVILTSARNKVSPAISILRFFQVLRMIRFDRQAGTWKLLGSVLYLHRQELLTTFYIGFCSLIFASFFVYLAEKEGNPEEFGTFADSFWWGVVTLTTVGYGDKIPISWAGRGIAAFFAIMGISFFALPAGILGSGFALKVSQQQRQKQAKRRRRPAAMLIQCNWRYYAARKSSKLLATWLPYIRYIQETNYRVEQVKGMPTISEKPLQPAGRIRKKSIFARKSSETFAKPDTGCAFLEHYRSRSKKSIENNPFPSNDSFPDVHSSSTGDQNTDEEHGGNNVSPKAIAITDSDGKFCLPSSYKQSIRFIRYLKFLVALRKFKLAKRPYDVKDVIEQYSTGHVELLGKVKGIGYKIDHALGYKIGTDKIDENPSNTRSNVVYRLSKLETQVKTLDFKLDRMLYLLENSTKKDHPVIRSLSEDAGDLSACTSSTTNQKETLPLPERPKTSSRRQKCAFHNSNPTVSGSSLENEAIVNKEDEATGGVSCLTTEDYDEDLNSIQMHDYHQRENAPKEGRDHGLFGEKYLSPKPFDCDSYDVRSRSDGAISSSVHEKRDDQRHSVAELNATQSDSEETTVNVPVNEQLSKKSSDTLDTPSSLLSLHGANSLQETMM